MPWLSMLWHNQLPPTNVETSCPLQGLCAEPLPLPLDLSNIINNFIVCYDNGLNTDVVPWGTKDVVIWCTKLYCTSMW